MDKRLLKLAERVYQLSPSECLLKIAEARARGFSHQFMQPLVISYFMHMKEDLLAALPEEWTREPDLIEKMFPIFNCTIKDI